MKGEPMLRSQIEKTAYDSLPQSYKDVVTIVREMEEVGTVGLYDTIISLAEIKRDLIGERRSASESFYQMCRLFVDIYDNASYEEVNSFLGLFYLMYKGEIVCHQCGQPIHKIVDGKPVEYDIISREIWHSECAFDQMLETCHSRSEMCSGCLSCYFYDKCGIVERDLPVARQCPECKEDVRHWAEPREDETFECYVCGYIGNVADLGETAEPGC